MRWNGIPAEIGASLKFQRSRTILTVLSLAWGLACFEILMSRGDGFARAMSDSFTAGGMRSGRRVHLDLAGPWPPPARSGCSKPSADAAAPFWRSSR
jgi:hypothetical protein